MWICYSSWSSDNQESTCNTSAPGSILGFGRSSGEEMATHSSILVWRVPWILSHGVTESDTTEWLTVLLLWASTSLYQRSAVMLYDLWKCLTSLNLTGKVLPICLQPAFASVPYSSPFNNYTLSCLMTSVSLPASFCSIIFFSNCVLGITTDAILCIVILFNSILKVWRKKPSPLNRYTYGDIPQIVIKTPVREASYRRHIHAILCETIPS